METLIIYLAKVSIAIALFYVLHILLLRKETFFKLRRFYFLFALIFSLLYPFINVYWEVNERSELPLPAYVMSEIEVFVDTQKTVWSLTEAGNPIALSHILIGIVALGILCLLVRFLVQLTSLFLRLKRLDSKEFNGYKLMVIEDVSIPSFSFFHWIVINSSNSSERQISDIVCHEEAHAQQCHSIDVVLYEVFCIFFWWNPFVWLLKNEMKLNLEYLADEVVQSNKSDFKEYQYTLLQISTANTGVAFINNFNVSHLKKRISMMNKKRSSKFWLGKYLLALPLALALVLGNVVYAAPEGTKVSDNLNLQDTTKQLVFTVVEQMPNFPGGEAEMMKYIANSLRYPQEAQDASAQGRVVVRFVVDKTGKITDPKVVHNGVVLDDKADEVVVTKEGVKTKTTISLSDIKKTIDEESLRVIREMPNWEPGKQNGKDVPVYFTLPILFRLK